MPKTVLTGLSREQLREFAESCGEKPYRGDQLFAWIYAKGATTFSEMSNLSQEVRSMLEERASLGTLSIVQERRSKDGTLKVLFELQDGLRIESVLIPPDPSSPGAEKRTAPHRT